MERGQGADSQPSSVGEFLSVGYPQPLPRWLKMNLPWQAYTNQTSCSRDLRRLPGAQSEGFRDRDADPTACLEIITQACPPFSLSSPQPATPACDLWPPLSKRGWKGRREVGGMHGPRYQSEWNGTKRFWSKGKWMIRFWGGGIINLCKNCYSCSSIYILCKGKFNYYYSNILLFHF